MRSSSALAATRRARRSRTSSSHGSQCMYVERMVTRSRGITKMPCAQPRTLCLAMLLHLRQACALHAHMLCRNAGNLKEVSGAWQATAFNNQCSPYELLPRSELVQDASGNAQHA